MLLLVLLLQQEHGGTRWRSRGYTTQEGCNLNGELKLEWAVNRSYLGMTEEITEWGCAALVFILLLKKLFPYIYFHIPACNALNLTILQRLSLQISKWFCLDFLRIQHLPMQQITWRTNHCSEFWPCLFHEVGEGLINVCLLEWRH